MPDEERPTADARLPTAHELAEFLAQPPPRKVPPRIAARVYRGNPLWIVIPALFFVVGVGATYFASGERLLGHLRMALGTETVTGEVVTSTALAGQDPADGEVVFEHTFRFQSATGETVESHSYETGRQAKPGDAVEIEYLPASPHIARIANTRLSPYGLLGLAFLLVPLGAVLLWYLPHRIRRRTHDLFRDGVFVEGTVVDVRHTLVRESSGRGSRYLASLVFETAGVRHQLTRGVYGPDAALAERHLENQERIGLLCDPRKPKNVLFTARLLEEPKLFRHASWNR